MNKKSSTFLILLISILSCCDENNEDVFSYTSFIPQDFPLPSLDSFPTEAQVTLGKKLFYENLLSSTGEINCASCHKPSLAFADTFAISPGVMGRLGTRNALSLANVVYQSKLLRENALPTLEQQVLVPIQEHAEFNNNIVDIAERLKTIPQYVDLAKAAYNREIDPFVITRSIAAFQRTIFSGNSTYDAFKRGKLSLTDGEKHGMDLFFSDRTKCSFCHSGFLFTSQALENNGIYETYVDVGAFRVTEKDEDIGKFKVPSLRNIAITYPYMHDGSFKTLEEVIDHYNKGGSSHPNKSAMVKPLFLEDNEKADLVAFLKTLTDKDFLNDIRYK